MRPPIALIVAVVVVAIVIGVSMWLVTDRGQPAESAEILTAPPQFDTTGGQEMPPLESTRRGE